MNSRNILYAGSLLLALATSVSAGEEHWSRQFKWPDSSYKMGPNTGMSDGSGKPQIKVVKYHDGKLWFGGIWSPGVSGWNAGKRQLNHSWHIWTYSEQEGWRAFAHAHSAQGGVGPTGTIEDFLWLPDGRMVVVGGIRKLYNPGGIEYFRVAGLAIYNPKEPGPNKWKPLGSFQQNGVGATGYLYCLAYDPQGNDLYMGGSFAGIRGKESQLKEPLSPGIHKYDFDTGSYELVFPGIKGGKATVRKIHVDTSTKPSTIYIAGGFKYTGGNGLNPSKSKSTARHTAGFAKYQEGKGWTLFPKGGVEAGKGASNAILQRAADFMYFDSAQVHDFLVDGKDVWIVGSFSEGKGSGEKLRGIAKWDEAKQKWIDPTGKGGIGRECFAIGKADNGKIYFAGAFGGPVAGKYYKGFQNGDPAHMAISYDPKTKTWEQLGNGLEGINQPECRLTVHGNDVYYYGDFKVIGKGRKGKGKEKEFQSNFIARWNETRDFVKDPVKTGTVNYGRDYFVPPTKHAFADQGLEHWSRAYVKAPRAVGKKSMMSNKTGMDIGTGTPEIKGMIKHKGIYYFVGRWEALRGQQWLVWSYDPKNPKGWERVAYVERGKGEGVPSTPEGIKLYDGKLYVYGPIKDYWGVGIYDPETKKWSKLEGKTHDGKPTIGISADPKRGSPVMDMAFDEKTGDIYMIGGNGYHSTTKHKDMVGQVIRRNKDGLCEPMGRAFLPEIVGKPVVTIDSIYLDKTKDPVDIYVGGTWGFCGGTTKKTKAYNIAKWDYKLEDWRPLGKGCKLLVSGLSSDQAKFPEGLPGLPFRPGETFHSFLNAGFPRVREITMDAEGNLYVGGTMALVDRSRPIRDRHPKESYGIIRLNAKTNLWEPVTNVGGFSRDVFQMTWLDEGRTKMLVSGGFHYDNQWRWLGSICTLDVKSGEVSPIGGGLHVGTKGQVFSSNVRHYVDGDDWYFTGFFDYAGINRDDLLQGPVESFHFAHYNAKKNMDPNAGLSIAPIEPVERPKTFGSKSYSVKIEAKLEGAPGELTWYELTTTRKWKKVGSGTSYTAKLRVKSDDPRDPMVYVTVTRDGVEGGKHPVIIPTK